MAKMSNIDYLMFKIRGRIVKVDPDIYYKIKNPGHERPCRKYNGDITSMRVTSEGYPVIVCGEKPPHRHTLLSRFVVEAKEGQIIDHINRNPLDNRRKNLRIVTKRQNSLNKWCKNGSGFVGVSIKHRGGRQYCAAKFQDNSGKELSFQLPDSSRNRIIAAFARDKFVLQAGEEDYAPLNFPCFRDEPFRSALLKVDLRVLAKRNRQINRKEL
jgi:hypothetical protein